LYYFERNQELLGWAGLKYNTEMVNNKIHFTTLVTNENSGAKDMQVKPVLLGWIMVLMYENSCNGSSCAYDNIASNRILQKNWTRND
jgi:hypothetical protein